MKETSKIVFKAMLSHLNGKSVILGVTGSIAAVKAAALARELVRVGAAVTCVMTESAEQFVSREEMRDATGMEIIGSLFPGEPPPNPRLEKSGEQLLEKAEGQVLEKAGGILDGKTENHLRVPSYSASLHSRASFSELTWHVHLARSCDAMLIAPCSATTIGKLRVGIYDNAVTLAAASLPKGTPLIIVPAMDEDMWLQPAVQENLQWLKQKGVLVIEPVSGALASGLVGMGRMSEPETIVEQLGSLLGMGEPPPCIVDDAPRLKKAGENLNKKAAELAGKKVLITGGPTYEPIDAVRFIGNRSSGKMAVALALEAREMGAVVTLIMGPTAPFPRLEKAGVIPLQIETAQEMLDAVKAEAPKADIIIMSAAVADFAPEQRAEGKLKKGSEATMTLRLKKNPDLLAEIAKSKKAGQIVVGFALEKGEEAEVYARKKLVEKNLDLIVLNNIAEEGVGFGHDTNKISLFRKNGDSESFPLLTKEECAKIIFELLVKMLS